MTSRGPQPPFAAFLAFLRFDLAAEWRRKSSLAAMAATALVVLFVLSFAIDGRQAEATQSRAGVLWVTWLFAGIVGVDRSFRGEGRMLEGLLLAPASRASLFYARVASTFLFSLAVALLSLPLFLALFNVPVSAAGAAWLAATMALMLLAMASSGVLLAGVTWSLRGGDVLLRILLLPILLPPFAAAVRATVQLFDGKDPSGLALGMLAAFCLVFLGAGHLLFEHVVDDIGTQE